MSDAQSIEIWYLIGSLDVGGANRVLVDLANNLPASRYEVTVWTILDDNPLAEDLEDSVTHRSLSATGKYDLFAVSEFLWALREGPDVLQSFCLYDNLLAGIAGGMYPDLPVVTGVRSVPTRPGIRRRTIDRIAFYGSDWVVSNSESGAEFAARYGVESGAVRVISNGRDLTPYVRATGDRSLYDELEISEASPVVGTVGRLIERKGHEDIITAWPQIRERHPEAHLVLVGDGPHRSALEELIEATGEANSIHLLGRRDDVPSVLDTMDLFVFPSHFEGLPNALMEAMAAGLPIVTTPVDGNAELVTDGETGVFVPVEDPDALAASVIDVLGRPDNGASLGEAARDHVLSEYSIDRMVTEFDKLYRELVSRASKDVATTR